MSTRLVANRMYAQQVAAGADQVVAGLWVPAKSTIQRVSGYCTFEASVERGLNEVAQGALAAYVLPVVDPDSSGTMAVLWDTQVPKDSTADILDLDAGTADVTPFWEPGEVHWEQVFDVGSQPVRLFQRHFLASMGMNAIAVNRDPESTFDYEYIGGKTIRWDLKGPLSVAGPSLLAIAAASPATDRTSATAAVAGIAEEDWAQLQFIDEVLERAMLHVLGLVEAGAETPFEEATALLRQHLDPSVLEVSGGIFQPTTWNLVGEAQMTIDVQGSLPRGQTINLGA